MWPEVERRLQALARSQGLGVHLSAESHGGRKLHLAYTRVADGQPERIEVDVDYLHRVCLLSTERRRMWRPDGEGPSATLLSWPEIAAGKLVASLDRAAPRDAWDVTRLASQSTTPWPPQDLRGLFVALAGTLPRTLHEYGRHSLERIRDADVSRLLWPMLIGGEQPTRPCFATNRGPSWSHSSSSPRPMSNSAIGSKRVSSARSCCPSKSRRSASAFGAIRRSSGRPRTLVITRRGDGVRSPDFRSGV